MFTTIRVISKHQDTQIYGAILPQHLTNQAMLKSEAYKTYHAYATGDKIPKPKYVKNKVNPESSPKKKSAQASKGKRLKTSTKVAKLAKKKQHATTSKAKGLNVLSEVALSETEQMKLATKKSKTQFHSSQASGSGVDEGTGVSPGVPTYNSKDEQISWKSSDEDNDDEANMSENDDQNDENVDNEGDDDQDDDNEQTESDNDDDDFVHPKLSTFDKKKYKIKKITKKSGLTMKHMMKKLKVAMMRKKGWMKKRQIKRKKQMNFIKDTHVMINVVTPEVQQQSSSVSSSFISNMLNPYPDISIDSILNLNTESTSLADVPITTNAEMPPLSMNEAIKAGVQLQSDRLREEAQAENEEFINKFDENMKKIFKEQEALYKALVNAYETNKDILDTYGDTVTFKRCQDYEDKDKDPSARSNWGSKRRKTGKEPESTSAPKEKTSMSSGKSKERSKSHQNSTGKSVQAKEPIHADENLEEPAHQEFDIRFTEDQPVDETTQHPDWFQKPTKPPTPSRDWNKTLPAKHGPIMDTSNGLNTSSQTRCGVKCQVSKTNMHYGASLSNWGRKTSTILGFADNKGICSRMNVLLWVSSLEELEEALSLKMRVKDLQLGVESYQKKLNLTRPDTYRSDLKRKTPYTAYSNPKGFIYQNKDKKNRLMHIDELHKFSDGTLTDVRSALNDILKRIRMEYLP
ncbi:hypothetical protein Tco_0448385 [Tanacetum coccineum]